jgi:nucleoid DNA-binding protein
MTKTELQSALAEATQTDKRTAGVFLDTLSDIAYKEIKKNHGERSDVLSVRVVDYAGV